MNSEVETFIEVLGVTIAEVPDMNGDCMSWDSVARVVTVCAQLCTRKRGAWFGEVLAEL